MASAPDRIVRLPLTRHTRRFQHEQRHPDAMADDGVYLVPADDAPCTVDTVRLLTDQEEHGQLQHVTFPQILYTASVLVKRNCPVDVVNSILEFAGMFLSFHQETEERVYGRDNMNEEYVRLDLPSRDEMALPEGIAVSKCVFLAIECVSKDQGWASFQHELNDTYYGSCTWLEVAIEKPAAAVAAAEEAQASDDSTKTATNPTEGNGHHDPDDVPAEADGDEATAATKVEVARVPALYNVRAHRNFRHHLKSFQDPKGLIHHIELGDSVRLMLRSEYPGWSNSAKFGKVSAFFALEFDEEFSFADVPFPESPSVDELREGSTGGDGRFACDLQ